MSSQTNDQSVPLEFRDDCLAAMFECYPGVVLAGFVYGASVLPIGGALSCIVFGAPVVSVEIIARLVVGVVFASGAGGIIAGLVAPFAILFVYAFNASLGFAINDRECVSAASGLTGYLPLFAAMSVDESIDGEWFFLFLLGPVMAMVSGIYIVRWYAHRREIHDWMANRAISFRLGIRHLMAATIWFALLFAVTKLSGSFRFVVCVAVWIAIYAILLLAEKLVRAVVKPTGQNR